MTDSDRPGPTHSEQDGQRPPETDTVGNRQTDSDADRQGPAGSEAARQRPSATDRTDAHTITVREAATRFDQAAVPRTERSITRWCHANRQGIARLDAFYDDNENRFYITPESIDRAIEEEKAKERRDGYPGNGSGPHRHGPASDPAGTEAPTGRTRDFRPGEDSADTGSMRELQAQLRDAEITSRAKDFYIERLESERTHMLERIESTSHRIGQLETRLQLGAGAGERAHPIDTHPHEDDHRDR